MPLRARVDLGAMAMKGYSAFPKAAALNLTIRLFSVISGYSLGGVGVLAPLQRSSRCILQPQPTGQMYYKCFCYFSLCWIWISLSLRSNGLEITTKFLAKRSPNLMVYIHAIHIQTHTHTHTYTHIYIYIYVYMWMCVLPISSATRTMWNKGIF